MARFRHKRLSRLQHLRVDARRRKLERNERRRQWTRLQEAQWAALHGICPDSATRGRLARLLGRLTGHDRGARESALAELELATLLIRAGFRVELLPESQQATADLQCWLGDARLFVEVTALVGGAVQRSTTPFFPRAWNGPQGGEAAGEPFLVSRLRSRIVQKARQLALYSAPVLLAATVPHRDVVDVRRSYSLKQDLDLKLLAGSITVLLFTLPHVSGVLLSLWDVEPLPTQSGVRLANVYLVERSRQQAAYPRVRLLVLNPSARAPLNEKQVNAVKRLL